MLILYPSPNQRYWALLIECNFYLYHIYIVFLFFVLCSSSFISVIISIYLSIHPSASLEEKHGKIIICKITLWPKYLKMQDVVIIMFFNAKRTIENFYMLVFLFQFQKKYFFIFGRFQLEFWHVRLTSHILQFLPMIWYMISVSWLKICMLFCQQTWRYLIHPHCCQQWCESKSGQIWKTQTDAPACLHTA